MNLCKRCEVAFVDSEGELCSGCSRKSSVKENRQPISADSRGTPKSEFIAHRDTTVESSIRPSEQLNLISTRVNTVPCGRVISSECHVDQARIGIRLFNAFLRRENFSMTGRVHHIQLSVDKNETLYVLFFGNLRGNYQVQVNNMIEVTGYFNHNHQLVARTIKDVSNGVVYRSKSVDYRVAGFMLLFCIVTATSAALLVHKYLKNLPVTLAVFVCIIIALLFSKQYHD
ncbi:TPA: hypothetical protein U1359_001050 [Streptococcus suis]|nr:hypothetical protein [Streptococcus suis]HEM5100404.1 hypothetical protein [Streptococcus suis]HEM5103230.1 hypothetical protein [Streptococcus suis]HEM5108293.1 hypothetical protein [Streptococcus suis]HEM5115129.1 hypothetical protein [Streptococcus suis]